MGKVLLISCALACLTMTAEAAMTRAQCAHEYDKCKGKIEHMFDKGPCKEARAACEKQASTAVQNATKNRMLNGETRDEGTGLDRWGRRDGDTIADRKAAARRRLEAREDQRDEARAGSGGGMRDRVNAGSGGMRDQVSGGSSVDASGASDARNKAAALRRAKERQRAQNGATPAASGGGMRESLKKSN